MSAPTYYHRLRLEGAVLAGCGALGSVILLAVTTQSRASPASTVGQLLFVAAVLAWLSPRGLRRAIASGRERAPDAIGSGEPTPLWHIVAIVVILSVGAGVVGGWDAGLRVTGGCLLVGVAQAALLAGLVARDQQATGRIYYRVPGSRILRGTQLGYVVTRPGGRATERA